MQISLSKSWWYDIYSSWYIEQNILKLVTLGHFFPFYPPKEPQIKILKNKKNCWRYHYFTNVYQKLQCTIYGSWGTEWDRHSFLSFWAIFCPFTSSPNTSWPLPAIKIKILSTFENFYQISPKFMKMGHKRFGRFMEFSME